MGLFGNIFGGLFDFNHDRETSFDEELMGLNIVNQIANDSKSTENDDWRDYADDNDHGIDPDDYDTEEEYIEAIEDAENDY